MKNYFIAKSRRVRSTPYTSRIENQGVTAYTAYNHMLLPAAFGSLEDSYHHLKEHVQVWDVAGERQVEISGKDSAKLVQLMTCRDLSKSKVGRCYYCPIIDNKAGLINDPVSAKHLIARSGWSKQGGYEIYVENIKSGLALYDQLFELGKEFNVKPGCPNLIERIESALLSYGNDIDNNDNPLECGLNKYVNLDTDVNFLGKEKLKEVRKQGITRKLMGVKIESKEINVAKSIKIIDEKNNEIGELRSGVYSPHFGKVIGIAMMTKPYWNNSQTFKIELNGTSFDGKVCDLPFI